MNRLIFPALTFILMLAMFGLGNKPTRLIASSPQPAAYQMSWPILPFTPEQVAEARGCIISDLLKDRFQGLENIDDIAAAYEETTTCDWAVLFAAFIMQNDNPQTSKVEIGQLPAIAYEAINHTIEMNPAFLLKAEIARAYFDLVPLADAPPISHQPIQTALVRYSYATMGLQIRASVIVTNANSPSPVVVGYLGTSDDFREPLIEQPLPETINPSLIQGLRYSLTDLLPIDSQFTAIGCTDYYPEWDILLTFQDGTVLSVSTQGTNYLVDGGPWQVKIDGQNYLQYSFDLQQAANRLAEAFHFPREGGTGMECEPYADWLDFTYP